MKFQITFFSTYWVREAITSLFTYLIHWDKYLYQYHTHTKQNKHLCRVTNSIYIRFIILQIRIVKLFSLSKMSHLDFSDREKNNFFLLFFFLFKNRFDQLYNTNERKNECLINEWMNAYISFLFNHSIRYDTKKRKEKRRDEERSKC